MQPDRRRRAAQPTAQTARLAALYVDFQCPYSARVWRWLEWLPEVREQVEVRPFSLDTQRVEGRGPWDRTRQSSGLELLALGEYAREAGRHHAFVDAAFHAIHEDGSEALQLWLDLGAEIGLDMAEFTEDSERWRAEVGLWHEEGRDDLGVEGTPTLVFDRDGSERAMLLRVEADLPDEATARRLLADLTDLVLLPVDEIRRTA